MGGGEIGMVDLDAAEAALLSEPAAKDQVEEVQLLPGMAPDDAGAAASEVQPATHACAPEMIYPTESPRTNLRDRTPAAVAEREFIRLYPTSKPIHTLWCSVDSDGDGFLSEREVATLCKTLGVRWSGQQVWTAATRIAERNGRNLQLEWQDDAIDFAMFVQLYQTLMGVERRSVRGVVKGAFERLDYNRSGTLEKRQVEQLVKTKSIRRALRLLPPAFDIERDWAEMGDIAGTDLENDAMASAVAKVTKTGKFQTTRETKKVGVSWDVFETWWKGRLGLIEADTAVLPEWFYYRFRQVKPLGQDTTSNAKGASEAAESAEAGPAAIQKARSGRELWNWLVPRLYMMTRMRLEWGDLHAVYGHADSAYIEPPIPTTIRDPESMFSVVWDLLQIVFLLYVSTTVPFRASFPVKVASFSLGWWVDIVVDVYFVVDLLLSFRTAYVSDKGVRVVDPKQIGEHYMRSWFAIDFVSCIPVGHIADLLESEVAVDMAGSVAGGAVEDGSNSSNLRALKTLRLIRLSKMLRLTKIKRILQKYENLVELQQYIGLIVMLCVIIFTAHFLACIWYYAGTDVQTLSHSYVTELAGADTEEYDPRNGYSGSNRLMKPGDTPADVARDNPAPKLAGWVGRMAWSDTPADPQASSESVASAVGISTRYIASMYFALNPLDNYSTDTERLVGIFAYLCTILIQGCVAGVLSALFVGMSGDDQELNIKLRNTKRWMTSSRIPRHTQALALAFFSDHYKQNQLNERLLLAEMPPAMGEEFRRHLYHKFLRTVPLFADLSEQIISALCNFVQPVNLAKGQHVFEEGSRGKEMYMLIQGELEVTQQGERLGFLSDGAFFGEVPLLDGKSPESELRTRTVVTMTSSKLCFITLSHLDALRAQYPELDLRLRRIARSGAKSKTGRDGSTDSRELKGRKLREAAVLRQKLREDAALQKWFEENDPVMAINFASMNAAERRARVVELQERGVEEGGIEPIIPSKLADSSSSQGHGLGASDSASMEEKMEAMLAAMEGRLLAAMTTKLDDSISELRLELNSSTTLRRER